MSPQTISATTSSPAHKPLISRLNMLEGIEKEEFLREYNTKETKRRMEQKKSSSCHFFHSTRFLILSLSLACLTFALANPLILNFTVICMDDVVEEYRSLGGNEILGDEELHWLQHPVRRNLMFSAVAMGNFIGTVPTTSIIQKLGTRNLFLIYGLVSAVSTLFFPLAVKIDIYWLLIATRLCQGFGQAFMLPAMGSVCSAWAPLSEAAVHLAVMSMSFQMSSIFTMPVSGLFCSSEALGWRSIFYLQGTITAALALIFYFFYSNDPQKHPCVSHKEADKIALNKEEGQSAIKGAIPYAAIMSTPCVVTIWLASLGGNSGFWLLAQFGPIYLNQVLGLAVTSTGVAAAMPFVLSALLKLVASHLSNIASCLSETSRILVFASISQGFMALCYVLMTFTESAVLAQILYTGAIVFSGLNIVGVMRCAQLVARQYMAFVMSVMNVINCAITLVLPALMSALVSVESTRAEWSVIFYGMAVLIVLSNVPFFFFVSSEAAPWTSSANSAKCSPACEKKQKMENPA